MPQLNRVAAYAKYTVLVGSIPVVFATGFKLFGIFIVFPMALLAVGVIG